MSTQCICSLHSHSYQLHAHLMHVCRKHYDCCVCMNRERSASKCLCPPPPSLPLPIPILPSPHLGVVILIGRVKAGTVASLSQQEKQQTTSGHTMNTVEQLGTAVPSFTILRTQPVPQSNMLLRCTFDYCLMQLHQ